MFDDREGVSGISTKQAGGGLNQPELLTSKYIRFPSDVRQHLLRLEDPTLVGSPFLRMGATKWDSKREPPPPVYFHKHDENT